MDLPCVIRHSHKKRHNRQHKRRLGKSIDLRDESVATAKNLVIGRDTVENKNKSDEVMCFIVRTQVSPMYVAVVYPLKLWM